MACMLSLLVNITVIAICSSEEPVRAFGMSISPTFQVMAASWSFIGIPITVAAGVGALHRIEQNIKVFFWYAAASLVPGVCIPIYFVFSGSVCNSTVDPELQRMGAAFVCGFTDTFVLMWTLLMGLLHAYIVYIVWSAAQEIEKE